MAPPAPNTPWTDAAWAESSDNRWQAGLRRQQAWWRETQLNMPAGSRTKKPGDRLVSSMLPIGAGLEANVWTREGRQAVERARSDLAGRPGMIQPDRLERNLLSSQPLAFNLFGYLASYPDALLPWVRSFDRRAETVADVRLEWAQKGDALGGSAFDAFVEYLLPAGKRGFVGVEVKYNEDLAKAQPKMAGSKYTAETRRRTGDWRRGASPQLDRPKASAVLVQPVARAADSRPTGIRRTGVRSLLPARLTRSAREVTANVAAFLTEPESLQFSAIEEVVASVEGHPDWHHEFTKRYTDFAPIQEFLPASDPRRI